MTHPVPRVIYCDVDGTLHRNGMANTRLIAWLNDRKAEGFTLYLWSMRGDKHARDWAHSLGIVELFAAIVPKPGYIVDDQGWTWVKFTRCIRSLSTDLVGD